MWEKKRRQTWWREEANFLNELTWLVTDYVIMVTICDKTNDNGYFMSIKAWALNIK